MLSSSVKRALLHSSWPLPPTFLLPWAASLTTVSYTPTTSAPPPPPPQQDTPLRRQESTLPSPTPNKSTALDLSPSLRELLPLLQAQSPHYITIHLHGKPYLVTQGDSIRLPFFMHGVEPGDILRLNRAINIGSRDYTLKPRAAPPKLKSPTTDTRNILDPTTRQWPSHNQTIPDVSVASNTSSAATNVLHAPHFIPHIAKGKHAYLDERLFVCRAIVMGVESEPLRIKEKTKRRQRKVKMVKSKHRFTVLKIRELRVKGLDEIEREASGGLME